MIIYTTRYQKMQYSANKRQKTIYLRCCVFCIRVRACIVFCIFFAICYNLTQKYIILSRYEPLFPGFLRCVAYSFYQYDTTKKI